MSTQSIESDFVSNPELEAKVIARLRWQIAELEEGEVRTIMGNALIASMDLSEMHEGGRALAFIRLACACRRELVKRQPDNNIRVQPR